MSVAPDLIPDTREADRTVCLKGGEFPLCPGDMGKPHRTAGESVSGAAGMTGPARRVAGPAGLLMLALLVSGAAPPSGVPATADIAVPVAPPAPPAADVPPDEPGDALPAQPFPETFAGIPEAVINEHLAIADCEDLASDHMRDRPPVIGQVSPVATVYAIPCVAGASDTSYRLYLHETGEIGGVHPLYFAVWSPDHAWTGTELLKAVRFDAASGRLTGEGAGAAGAGRSASCRVRGVWTWNRWAFALTRLETVGCAASVPAVVYP